MTWKLESEMYRDMVDDYSLACLLYLLEIVPSKSEAKRLLRQGAVRTITTDHTFKVDDTIAALGPFLGQYIKVGKLKRFRLGIKNDALVLEER